MAKFEFAECCGKSWTARVKDCVSKSACIVKFWRASGLSTGRRDGWEEGCDIVLIGFNPTVHTYVVAKFELYIYINHVYITYQCTLWPNLNLLGIWWKKLARTVLAKDVKDCTLE